MTNLAQLKLNQKDCIYYFKFISKITFLFYLAVMKFVTTAAEAGRKQISEANYISLLLILSVLVGLI